MKAAPVLLYGGISAALWNAILMAAGYAIGNNWDALRNVAERYAAATFVLILLAVAGIVARLAWDSRRA
jgi:membrane protein DedA with SNARE-associated domain